MSPGRKSRLTRLALADDPNLPRSGFFMNEALGNFLTSFIGCSTGANGLGEKNTNQHCTELKRPVIPCVGQHPSPSAHRKTTFH